MAGRSQGSGAPFRFTRVSLACFLGLLVFAPSASAAGLASELGSGVDVDRQEETGKVGFVGTSAGEPIESGLPASTPAAEVASSFLADHAKSFGLGDDSSGLRVTETERTAARGTAVRLAQTYKGLPVFGAEFVVNLDRSGDLLSVLGEASPSPDGPAGAEISADEAAAAAIGAVARADDVSPEQLEASTPRLQLYDPRLIGAPGPFQEGRVSWVLKVKASALSGIDELVVVDGETGAVAVHFSRDEEALNRIVCDANNTETQVPCTAPVRSEGDPPVVDATFNDVNDAYDFAGDTYDFFFNRFSLDSLDGAGMQLKQTVDYCDLPQRCPYQNAFWNGQQMVYGDGWTVDDVVGHELTHGVTDFSSHLFYYQQSGAINESLSDVFGEFIDLTNTPAEPAANRWKLAEGLPAPRANGIRNMKDPTLFSHPDRMNSSFYTSDSNENDAGGVHRNSGVNNKAAYLITDGDTFNGQTITGIGITKAARIYFTVNDSMLVSGSDYADLANAIRQACTNLAGAGTDGITPADCAEVDKALLATEMDQNPTSAPTSVAPPCTSGTPSNVFFDDLENTASGNFASAAVSGAVNGWFYPPKPTPFGDMTYATSGIRNLWGDNGSTVSDSAIRMTAAVPIQANTFLHFNHAYGFGDDTNNAYDGGVVEYSTNGAGGPWADAGPMFTAGGYNGTLSTVSNNPIEGRSAFVRESNGYGSSRANLASLSGQNVTFRWRIGTNSSLGDYGWFIDDVRIYTCPASPLLSIEDASISEGDSGQATLDFTVTLSQNAAVATGFDFATSDGTATQPADYVNTSGSGSIGVGSNSTVVSVPVKGDLLDEANEAFAVTISNPGGGSTIADATATGTINDNDPAPTLSIDDVSVNEGGSGQGNASLTVSLSAVSGQHVSVGYATGDGTATQPSDYATAAGSTTILAGQQTTQIAVPVNGDLADEADETFNLTLSGPTNATVADGSGVVTIVDDDLPAGGGGDGNADGGGGGGSDGGGGGGAGGGDVTAPDTTVSSGPPAKTRKGRATFAFSATEGASRFECRLDRGAFEPCDSPETVSRLKRGIHTFRVRATDATGNVDPTPARQTWKVKRKRGPT